MLRLLFLLHYSLLSLLACNGAFSPCVNKLNDSHSLNAHYINVAVSKNYRIFYAKTQPNAAVVKYDPFLNLYLTQEKHPFMYPFIFDNKVHNSSAIITLTDAKTGKFEKKQVGLNHFATYLPSTKKLALVVNRCCMLEGISTPDGIIQQEYLQHFLNTKTVAYSDIGIRLRDLKGSVVVEHADPFFQNNPFQRGDIITAFDGKKVVDAANLMQTILFSKRGSFHKVAIKREGKMITYKVKSQYRYGGGYVSDTFLERKGFYFDETLHIVRHTKQLKKYGLKVGDRVLKIDNIAVNNQEKLRLYLERNKAFSSMLIQRNNFDFFVKIK